MSANRLAVVTGSSSGIGRALAVELARRKVDVVATGRSPEALKTTREAAPDRIMAVEADLATEQGRAHLVGALPRNRVVTFLVHSAGKLEPVGPITGLTLQRWRDNMALNVEAPLFLTRDLLPRMSGGRVLHISSGAAHRPIPGWSAYCTAKAALYMIHRCLNAELNCREVLCGSVNPGTVDTPMQERIRGYADEQFPDVEYFRQLQKQGELHPPEEVARFLAWLLLECGDGAFPAREWDIADASHHTLWRRGR